MAMGIYVGAGSVKTVSSIYVGAGGVKTVKEVYVGAGGVKKVWPSYTDYGGDSPDIYANGYVNSYGWYARSNGRSSATQSTMEDYSHGYATGIGYSGYIGVTMNGTTIDPDSSNGGTGVYCYFCTDNPFDARGYNYMGFTMGIHIGYTTSTSGHTGNLQVAPLVCLAAAPDSYNSSDIIITSKGNISSKSVTYDTGYGSCVLVDLSNINTDDLYLKVGLILATSMNSSSYDAVGATRMGSSYHVYLYKNQSDCTLSTSGYDYGWTLSY